MENFPRPKQNNNIRSRYTDKVELRKLWHIPEAKYIWALYLGYEQETCELVDGEPNWDNIVKTEEGFTNPQGYVGDEEWAARTAEHFKIEMPTEEYQWSE